MLYNQEWDAIRSNPVSDVLMKGADLIEKHGHAKGIRKDDKGGFCFLGAVETVQGHTGVSSFQPDSELTHQAAKALFQVIDTTGIPQAERDDKRFVAANWNNLAERTAQEVIDAMRLAAKVHAKALVEA